MRNGSLQWKVVHCRDGDGIVKGCIRKLKIIEIGAYVLDIACVPRPLACEGDHSRGHVDRHDPFGYARKQARKRTAAATNIERKPAGARHVLQQPGVVAGIVIPNRGGVNSQAIEFARCFSNRVDNFLTSSRHINSVKSTSRASRPIAAKKIAAMNTMSAIIESACA